jgi:hypothetical protein
MWGVVCFVWFAVPKVLCSLMWGVVKLSVGWGVLQPSAGCGVAKWITASVPACRKVTGSILGRIPWWESSLHTKRHSHEMQ